MQKKEFTSEQVSQKFDTGFGLFDENQKTSLQQFSGLQSIQLRLLQKERDRLSQKYGTAHPRLQQIEAKLAIANGLDQELQEAVSASQIEVPTYNPKTWRIHGCVLNAQRQGIEGLVLSLFNADQQWIRELGFACTNKQGYFAIDYPAQNSQGDDINSPPVTPEQPLILTVTDRDRQIRYQDPTPLFINLGAIDYREIVLDLDQSPQPCPEPEAPSTPPPGPPKPVQIQEIEAPAELRVNQPGEFGVRVNANSTPPVTLTWNFGDDTDELTTAERLVLHSYQRPGNYQISVLAKNPGGQDSATTTVQVLAAAMPPDLQEIGTRPDNPTVGTPVQFRASVEGSPPIRGRWSFGDDSPAVEGLTATHTFRRSGTFEVELEVANDIGRDAQRLRLNVAPIPSAEPWRVQGKIQLLGGEPLGSLTVGLRLRDGTDPFDLPSTQTNDEGDYFFRFSPEGFARLFEADPKPNFFVAILDQQGVVRARADVPVQPQPGQTDERNITIRRSNPRSES